MGSLINIDEDEDMADFFGDTGLARDGEVEGGGMGDGDGDMEDSDGDMEDSDGEMEDVDTESSDTGGSDEEGNGEEGSDMEGDNMEDSDMEDSNHQEKSDAEDLEMRGSNGSGDRDPSSGCGDPDTDSKSGNSDDSGENFDIPVGSSGEDSETDDVEAEAHNSPALSGDNIKRNRLLTLLVSQQTTSLLLQTVTDVLIRLGI